MMVRLTQIKWKGTVSHRGTRAMATRLAAAKASQATSTQPEASARCRRSLDGGSIALTSHRHDRVGAQLGPEPADVDVHHIGARVEVVVPNRRGEPPLVDGPARGAPALPG